MTWISLALKLADRAGSFAAKAVGAVIETARRVVIYLCLAAVVLLGHLADRLDKNE